MTTPSAATAAKNAEGAPRSSDAQGRSAAAWALAKRQHGIVTRRDLLGLGFSGKAIKHRLATGRLHMVARGVYVVGWPELTRKQRWMAAVLVCGEGAALSHRSAAALWGIGNESDGRIDVSVRRGDAPRRPGIRARRRPSLTAEDIVVHEGIPVICLERTFVDLATELDRRRLERAINEADKHDRIGPEELRADLDRYAGEPGVRLLRAVLDRHTFLFSDFQSGDRLSPHRRSSRLPPPLTKT